MRRTDYRSIYLRALAEPLILLRDDQVARRDLVPAVRQRGGCLGRGRLAVRFWVDVSYENVKFDHPKVTKRRLIAQILHQYQDRGDAMRYLDEQGKIGWKASPRFLTKLADAERDAQDELEDFS